MLELISYLNSLIEDAAFATLPPPPPVAVIVRESAVVSVARDIPVPATNVRVSVVVSACIVPCPETPIFENTF